jgi:hypothetical protein
MSVDFQIAAKRAETRTGVIAWTMLGPRERADAIYEQLRVLDAERMHQVPPPPLL